MKEVQEKTPAEGLGVSPNFLFLSPKNGGRGLMTKSQRLHEEVTI
jgi:hypothetical protein